MWGKSQPVTHSSLPWRAVSNKSIQGSPQQQSHPNPPGLRRRCGRKADAEGEEAAAAPGAAPGRGAGRRCWSPPWPALGPRWEEGGVSQGGLFTGTRGL